MKIPNRVYNVLKWLCLVALPATSVLYAQLGAAWGFPYIDEICRTFAAVELFIGALIGVSTVAHNRETRDAMYERFLTEVGLDLRETVGDILESEGNDGK